MKNVTRMPHWWEAIQEPFSSLSMFSILIGAAALLLGAAIGGFDLVYGLAITGALLMVVVVLLRLNELSVVLIIAVHLLLDWYLGLHLVGILMALVLLFACYFGRSADHPWVWPRPLWLWVLFLVMTIYPAINGGQFRAYDAATYYPSDILGALLLFWLGSIIAKDAQALRRTLQLLAVLAALIAVHTIIEATTGVFLFLTSHEDTHLVGALNYTIIGTDASRAVSFFGDPNWNGCFLVTMVFLPLGLLIESKSFLGKLVSLVEMVLILVALLFTYSNGSWVALLAGVAAFVLWVGSQGYRVLLIVTIALAALLVVVLFPSQLAVQLQHASAPGELLLREGAWQTGIQVIKAFPLFGVGLGNQAYLIRANPYRVPAQFYPLDHPHDAYVQWGAMAGIPVLLLFLSLLSYGFWRSWRSWRTVDIRYRPLLGGGIAALIALSVNSVSIDGWTNAVMATIGWLIFGMLTSPLLLSPFRGQKRPEGQPDRGIESRETKA